MLDKAGYIYASKHEGWYCVSEETFYPQSGVQFTLDPATGRKIMVRNAFSVVGKCRF
jgi:methionyl-tRNA synthetase